MRKVLESILIAAVLIVPVCSGQEFLDEVNSRASQLSGIHLIGVSVFSGYSTSAYPQAGFATGTLGTASLGGDTSFGASASAGWLHQSDGTSLSVLYTGTYGGMVRYSNLDAFSQGLSVSASRKLSSRWTFGLSASGQDSTVAQYLFQPSTVSVITQVPATFDDLAAAFSAGQYTNAQAASMLTGAPMMQMAGRSLLVGNRILTYSANANLGYAASPRLELHFSSFTAAGQTRLGGETDIAPASYVMPLSFGASAGAGFSYSWSPRSQVGVDVEANRNFNHFQSVYATSASAFLGRKMGMHWFMNLHAGGSYAIVTQQTIGTPQTHPMVGGGTLGFQTGMHTLVASYDRSASDPFGLAVGTSTTMNGAWNWHLAGSPWSVFASFAEQQTRNNGFISLSGWTGSAGLSTRLNPHTTLSAQYVYMSSTGTYVGTFNNLSVQSVRVSLGWAPQPVYR
jgi:hypothetical protein